MLLTIAHTWLEILTHSLIQTLEITVLILNVYLIKASGILHIRYWQTFFKFKLRTINYQKMSDDKIVCFNINLRLSAVLG
jgi:hypothetical protein